MLFNVHYRSISYIIAHGLSSEFFWFTPPGLFDRILPMEHDVLTIEELQTYLSCSRGFVYTLMRDHKLPHAKIGKRVYFRKKDVDKLLESRLVK